METLSTVAILLAGAAFWNTLVQKKRIDGVWEKLHRLQDAGFLPKEHDLEEAEE